MARGIQDLSAREREILELLANGLTNREIAAALYISPHTVKNHVSSIYRKLGVDDRTPRRCDRPPAGRGPAPGRPGPRLRVLVGALTCNLRVAGGGSAPSKR